MEKRDKVIVGVVGIIVVLLSFLFDLQYSSIAESGLTLASIVLAVYLAAIVGLINSDLARGMAKKESVKCSGKSELGVLSTYFKYAIACATITIALSTMALLTPIAGCATGVVSYCFRAFYSVAICFYTENLVFLCLLVRFILNRQLWNQ